MDSNIYCQGNFIVLKDNTENTVYKGGVLFTDKDNHEYADLSLYYNTGIFDGLYFTIPDNSVNGLCLQAYNYWWAQYGYQQTIGAQLSAYGLWGIGCQLFGYNPAWSPLYVDHTVGPANPGDYLVLADMHCSGTGSDAVHLLHLFGQEATAQNMGFLGYNYLGDGDVSNVLELGYFDSNTQIVTAQTVDMAGNVNFPKGKVGILKTSPAYPLDVVGDVNITGTFRKNGTDILAGVITDLAPLTLDKVNGRVGVNKVSPTYSLDVTGTGRTTGDLTVDSNLAVGGNIDLGNVSATLTVDTVNKRVGVVQPSPSYPLDVVGDVNTSTKYKIGGTDVLTSTTLGSGITSSSLTSVGTLSSLTVTGDVTIDSTTLKVDSTNNRVGIVNASPAYPLDVVGDVNTTTKYKIGGTDVVSVSSGDLVLGGNNVYHTPIENDLVCTIVPRGGTASLANVNSTGVYAYAFSAAGTSEVSFVCQLSHKWQEGSDITPHFHWCPETTNVGNCVFKLDYWIVNINENIPASVTTLTQTVATGGTAYTHKLCSFGAVSAVGKTASCLFGGRLYRDGNSGSDTFTGNAYILSVDLHVKNTRLGYNV